MTENERRDALLARLKGMREVSNTPTVSEEPGAVFDQGRATDRILSLLKKNDHSLEALASEGGLSRGQVLDLLDGLHSHGHGVEQHGSLWSLAKNQVPAFARDGQQRVQYQSNSDNTFTFGVCGDAHLGSKYERMDCLNDIYDRFAAAGITRVFNGGNWIEGISSFNKHEIHKHSLEEQIEYLVQAYPQRPGITTYAVTGDDHEGWFAQREGIDMGRYAQRAMRAAGREDWVDLGYMEAHIDLVNANTGKSAFMAVVHPGGGSSYADSYVVQKIIESLDGGAKPAVALYSHYHKCLAGEYRNVWWVLVPSTKDQDTFMRKKRIRSVVGGGIITLEQDPMTGAITGMTPKLWRYFEKGYYEGRWSHSGQVVLPERVA